MRDVCWSEFSHRDCELQKVAYSCNFQSDLCFSMIINHNLQGGLASYSGHGIS